MLLLIMQESERHASGRGAVLAIGVIFLFLALLLWWEK